ncbi:hypothetical protein CY35_09G004100 [Sphagnum magellanicum]|nr:hypothetical protein CY35_09G004100 [Sphagnum magellanicum]
MAALDLTRRTIAVIPGTGRIGSRLAFQYAKAGLSVVVGSRDAAKAQKIAAEISEETQSSSVKGLINAEAAASGDIIIWNPAGPLEDREELLKSLASHLVDKIIVDVTNVLYFFGESHWGQISATLLNRDALGAPARWTTAFKATIFVSKLQKLDLWKTPGLLSFLVPDGLVNSTSSMLVASCLHTGNLACEED